MAFNLANNPFMMGYMQDQTQRSDKRAVEKKDDSAKRREELVKMFDNDIKIVRDNLSKATDPKQREAIQSVLAQMKDAYGGAAAKEFGLDQQFSRTIDFAMQTPVDVSGSSMGSFGSLLNTAGLTPEEQARLAEQRARTLARGGSDPLIQAENKALGKEYGEYDAELQKVAVDVPVVLEQLKLVEDAVDGAVTGPIVGKYTPNLSTESQILDSQATKDALKFVNQTKGAVSDREMAMFKGASLGTDKRPEFNKSYLAIAKGILARKSQQAEFFQMWKQYNGTTDGAFNAFKKFAEDNPLFEIKGQSAKLLKPVEDIMADRSWEMYINEGGGGNIMPPIPPVDMSPNGEMSGGMIPPSNNNDGWTVEEVR